MDSVLELTTPAVRFVVGSTGLVLSVHSAAKFRSPASWLLTKPRATHKALNVLCFQVAMVKQHSYGGRKAGRIS